MLDMSLQQLKPFTQKIIAIIDEMGHYNISQVIDILRANQVSYTEINKAIKIIRVNNNLDVPELVD